MYEQYGSVHVVIFKQGCDLFSILRRSLLQHLIEAIKPL